MAATASMQQAGVNTNPRVGRFMANELNAEMLKVALKSIDDFAAKRASRFAADRSRRA